MKNMEILRVNTDRRQAIKGAIGLLTAALIPSAASALGPADRVADRMRGRIRKKHSIVAYHQASARQRAAALANAKKLQAKYRTKWEKTPQGKAYVKTSGGGGSAKPGQSVDQAKAVPMSIVVKDLQVAPVQAVKVPAESAGARAAVLPVDLRTGGLVGNGVVEMASAPRAGGSITEQVREAVADGTIQGNASEWLGGDVVLASL
ncbi:MAG TPA: hypothetical protein PK529_01125 [Verrucomicrobiales bacterium]|nr:hypothetical protein [Verrucomicrobiales bacterium]